MSSFCSDSIHEKRGRLFVDSQQVDTGALLLAGVQSPLEPGESLRIRRKIDRHILPLMCILNWIQYMDKTTLGNSAILGIQKATHLTTNQYNWLGTVFYISYFAFEFPQSLALQRFPVGKWMSLNAVIWGIALCCHAACTNFAGLFAARFVLGMCEGSTTAGFMIVSSMFYTRREHTARVGYWILINGIAQIIAGVISFGSLHIHTPGFESWQWFMVITGALTLVTAISFFLLFPDSPTTAWFLTPDERVKAVQRIKENQTGVENKQFKEEQMIEALMDSKTWLFSLFAVSAGIPNSLTNQLQIIVLSFGFNAVHTVLLVSVIGIVGIVAILAGVTIVSYIPNSRAWVGIAFIIPNLIGVFLVNLLPWHEKIGLLLAVWMQGIGVTSPVLALAWMSQTVAGHTKRITMTAVMLSAQCLGNALGPFMWRAKYKPRNHVPWTILGICYALCIALLFAIRMRLARENERRDVEPLDDTFDNVYVVRVDGEGNRVELKVPKVRDRPLAKPTSYLGLIELVRFYEQEFLDLTDEQNRAFRYVL
ncbi:MFS general substrate transporter [Russula brevipes]|nr:MFS general substrate transporter [Russula brevipes]